MKRTSVVRAVLGALCPLLALCLALALTGCVATPANPKGITAAQRKAATSANLELLWSQVQPGDPGFHRPATRIIRYVTYRDAASVLTECMARAGYPHVAWGLTTGLVDTDLKPVDRFPVEVAIFVCEAEYPSDPLELGYLSDAQEQYIYTYWAYETVPCLRAHGALAESLPPVGEFGEGYEDVGELNPYTHLLVPQGLSESYLVAVCPPYPGELYPKGE